MDGTLHSRRFTQPIFKNVVKSSERGINLRGDKMFLLILSTGAGSGRNWRIDFPSPISPHPLHGES
jgi:hypothetical protein